ncbi:MAG: ABC transporter permease [Rhodospirillaceae bacterium]|jgi:peptide/nickel transport system permease protein|nr:ABC transporter permease [Rhodospirillaceae bacterium]MBT4487595.1 ABC transporter permease [Rhodospirillaceae bacterium]MBT5192103.1 ABC transporter permease [Rhodospirillaceae bacterium]MBT5897429.1 ABC transporter permease [Rhodospirillaceae bacterium]MBT6428352.1 ABC transporter permease [Rhodospirillaceae bacterium]
MYKYAVKRILLMIPTLIGAGILVFMLMRMIPGDICEIRLGGTGLMVDKEQIDICRENLGLNDSLAKQFLDFAVGIATLNFGDSMWTGRPVTEEISVRFQLTLQIAIMATLTAVIIALPFGVISAIKQNTWVDYCIRLFSIAGIATPSFWLGIMIILGLLIVSQQLFGEPWMMPIQFVPIWEDPLANLSQTIWPAVAVGYRYAAVVVRMTRSAMLEVLREDYVRTARAKGLFEKIIVNQHALKNALLPVVTLVGIEFAFLIGGLVVTEQVFNLNGLGKLFVDAVLDHDFTLTQSLVMMVVTVFVVVNLLVDLIYAWIDPRIHYT